MKRKALLTAFLIGCVVTNVFAQMTVNGRIIDADTNLPINGANIKVSHSSTGCTTNGNGEFSINMPNGKQTLKVTHIGYKPSTYTTEKSEKGVTIRLENNYINMDQVVVTGTGTHKRMSESPVPISVITAKDLKDASITTFEEAMSKLTPTFSFITNGMGTTMSMNGLPEGYVLILENGKRLAGDDTYTRIDMANVKRIEILNGAASSLYGSDAIAGVINIITDDSKNRINIGSNTRYSTKNRFTQSVNADVHSGKFGSYTSYQRQQADGWQLNAFEEVKDKKTEEVKLEATDKEASTAFHSNSISQRFVYDASNRLSFYARGGYYNSANDRPITEYKYNILHESYIYGAGAQYIINKSSYINADFFADNFTSSYGYIQKSGNFQPGDEEERKHTRYYNANVRGVFGLGKYNKLSAGTEFVSEYLTSQSESIEKKTMYTMAVFAQDEITISKNLQAFIGLRYIYHENFKNYATPNVALLYNLYGVNLRASYAAGFRTPTLSQLYATDVAKTNDRLTLGNANLKPEKNDYFSFNAEYVHSRFSITATAFINNVRNMINYRTLSPEEAMQYGHDEVRQRDNIDKARIKGANIAFSSYLGAGFTLNGGYSYIDAKDVHTNKPIDKSLKHAGNIAAMWAHNWNNYRLNVNLNGRIQGERYSQTYGYAPKFQIWNLNTTHTFNLGDFVLEPGVGIENIFNYKDDRFWNSNYATLTPGFSPYVSLRLHFKQ